MRILFCASPGVGHVEPMMPLLATMAHRGHEVAWAGAPESHARACSVGIEHCFQVGPGSAETRVEYLRRWPAASNAEGPASDPHVFPRRFGALLAPAMLDPLVRAIETWKPALVISELGVLAAPLACELTRCRQVTHGFGMPPPASVLDQAAAEFATQWRSKAFRSPPAEAGLFDSLYLDIYPESLQTPDRLRVGPRRQCLRPSPPAAGPGVQLPAAMVAHFLPIEARPLVHLTFGTVVNRSEALVLATRALADLDARVVVTIGTDGDASLLDSPPSNVMSSGSSRKRCSCRIARWLFRMGALVRFCRPWRMECPSWLCRKARISSSTRQRSRTGAPVWPSGAPRSRSIPCAPRSRDSCRSPATEGKRNAMPGRSPKCRVPMMSRRVSRLSIHMAPTVQGKLPALQPFDVHDGSALRSESSFSGIPPLPARRQ